LTPVTCYASATTLTASISYRRTDIVCTIATITTICIPAIPSYTTITSGSIASFCAIGVAAITTVCAPALGASEPASSVFVINLTCITTFTCYPSVTTFTCYPSVTAISIASISPLAANTACCTYRSC
jgi:hypothetical protein